MNQTAQAETLEEKLQKIADHLIFLEKKIDTLIEKSQTQRRPFEGGFRPRTGQGGHYGGPRREGGFRPQRNYSGPSGPHGTRTARYEGGQRPHRHRPSH